MENTFFEAPEYPVLEKLKRSIVFFLKCSLALFATMIFVRLLEYTYIAVKGQLPANFFWLALRALVFDFIFLMKSLPVLYLPYLLFYFSFNTKKHIFISTGIIFSSYILIYLLLLKYFFTALVPLGADLYGYSVDDVSATVAGSLNIDFFTVIIFILPFVLLWFALRYVDRILFIKWKVAAGVMVLSLLLLYFNVSALPNPSGFKTDYAYNIAINKPAYFFEKSYKFFFDDEPEVDIYASNYFEDGTDANGTVKHQLKYVDNAYPFLREDNTEDVLGNFFQIDSLNRPNIVFIQVEGLGRAFSGPNAYLGSFTPFLDELRSQSLYFENFLAAQGRTFASLPSILGSLPYFAKGYNDLGTKMPKAFTAFSLLNHNGYHSSFIMSTDLGFDNEGDFLRAQGVKQIISKTNFGEFPASHNTYWGYPDLDLMKKAIGVYSKQTTTPFVSYIQTISMHTPYKVPEMDKYYRLFETQMNKLGFDEAAKNDRRGNKDQYATILYTDESLRYFFEEFKKLPSYKHTIFILTGDHRLPEIPISTKIDRYHVPLIIYSPMLKRKASIGAVSSHLDITPSLMKFLKNNYKLKTPEVVTWVGTGLDTVKQFRNIHSYPLKQTVSELIDFVSGEYFLNDNTLFSMGDNFSLQPVDDKAKLAQLKSEFDQYKSQNIQVSKTLKLIPDSLYRKFKP